MHCVNTLFYLAPQLCRTPRQVHNKSLGNSIEIDAAVQQYVGFPESSLVGIPSLGKIIRYKNLTPLFRSCFRAFFLGAMAKIGYTRKPDGQNRVPPSTLVPGRHLISQRPPRPDSGRISNGSTRFWLLTPPSATRFQSHLPDYGRVICTLFIFLRAKKYVSLKITLLSRLPNMTR